jgi:hypothetical protein
MWVDGFDYRYYAGRKIENGRETYVSALVSKNNDDIFAQLTVAERDAMQNKMVDAAAMAKGLGESGHIALYGIYFDTDKAVIKPESRPTLDQIAKLLSGQPVRPERRSQGASPEQGCFPLWRGIRTSDARERSEARLTATLRDADRGGDAPHLHRLCAAAQVVWSLPKSVLCVFQPETQGTAETTASGFDRCRGEHEASRKTIACGTPDVSGAFVVTNSCACFYRA